MDAMREERLRSGVFLRQIEAPDHLPPLPPSPPLAGAGPEERSRAEERSPLRVLIITNMYPTADRPLMGTFVAEQVESLRSRGLLLDVLFIDGPGSKLNYLRGVADVRRIAACAPYHLIHAHYFFSAMLALAQQRLPVIVTQHGIETQQGWTAPLARWTSRRVAYTIATSPRVAETLPSARLSVIPCGVDTALFRPIPRAAARAHLGLPPDAPLVLFVGAPRPEKRLPLIQAAVAELQKTLPAARFVPVHQAPRAQVSLYMNACDVLILASTAEGSPMVVREALACDLPVVSTAVGDVPELLAGLPGCHLAEADAGDLAARLAQSLARGARTEGRPRILPWSLDGVAGRIETIYRDVL